MAFPEVAVDSSGEIRSLVVVGGQWGDEGKGKVVDLIAGAFESVVRYNGGHNAGHTVRHGERRFALHLVPSGIVHDGVLCALGAAMVVDPEALVAEIGKLTEQGVPVEGRLLVSERATLLLPTHRALDLARERSRGQDRIGTTGRGIGPAYQDLAQRRALRAFLLADLPRLEEEARRLMSEHNRELHQLYGADPVDLDEAVAAVVRAAERLGPMVGDVGQMLVAVRRGGGRILFEGAQGILLDVYHGTYPFVTSSSCLPSLAAVSCGVPPSLVGPVLGVMKAYETRVGSGPFPTELEDEAGERLRERGAEFGTTTGRPRRCGWFDAVAARYAVRVAGIDALALTKLDVLDGLGEVRIAVAYEDGSGRRYETPPADPAVLATLSPVYETLPGWAGDSAGVTEESGLPPGAAAYIERLEQLVGVPIVLVSTGPRRLETLVRGETPVARFLRDAAVTGA